MNTFLMDVTLPEDSKRMTFSIRVTPLSVRLLAEKFAREALKKTRELRIDHERAYVVADIDIMEFNIEKMIWKERMKTDE